MAKTRGQSSTEYLVVLGAVLMVGLVAVGTMVVLPSFGQATREQQFSQYWLRASPFKITAIKLSTGNVTLSIENGAKKILVLTGIEAGSNSQVIQVRGPGSPQSFRPGQEIAIANVSFNFAGNPCYGKALGTYYEFANITIIYTEGAIPDIRQAGLGLAGYCSGIDLTATVTPTPANMQYAVLSGWVRDVTAAGIAGATISLNSTTPQYATTNASGYYSLNASFEGNNTSFLANASAGFQYNYSTAVVALSSDDSASRDFVLAATSGIEFVLFIRNQAGANVAAFTPTGDIVLKAGCYAGASGSCASPPDGSFIVRDSGGVSHAYINSSGSLCIEDANCNYNDASCNIAPDGSFIVQTSVGTNVTYISPAGALCTIGQLRQYGTP